MPQAQNDAGQTDAVHGGGEAKTETSTTTPKPELGTTRVNLHPDASKTEEVPVLKGEQAYFLLHTINDRYEDVARRIDSKTMEAKSSEYKISDMDRYIYKFVQENKELFSFVAAETKAKAEAAGKLKGPGWFKKLAEKTITDPSFQQVVDKYQLKLDANQVRQLALIMEAEIRDFESASGLEVTGRHEAYESLGENGIHSRPVLDVYGRPKKEFVREGEISRRRYFKKDLADIYDVQYYGDKSQFVSDYVKNTPFLELSKEEQLDFLLRSYDQLDTLLESSTSIIRGSPVRGEHGFMGHDLFIHLDRMYQEILRTQYGGKTQAELSLKEYKEARQRATEKLAYEYGGDTLKTIAESRAQSETRLKNKESKRITKAKAAAGIKDGKEPAKGKTARYLEVVYDDRGQAIGQRQIDVTEYTTARQEITDLETAKKTAEAKLQELIKERAEKTVINNDIVRLRAEKTAQLTQFQAILTTAGGKTKEAIEGFRQLQDELSKLNAVPTRLAGIGNPTVVAVAAAGGAAAIPGATATGLIKEVEDEIARIDGEITTKTREFDLHYIKRTETAFDLYKAEQIENIIHAAENINEIVGDCFDIGERDHMLISFKNFRDHLQLSEGVLSNAQLGEALIKALNLTHINPNLLHSTDPAEQNFAQTQVLTALKGLTNSELAYDIVYQVIDKKLTAAEEGRPLDMGDLKQRQEYYREAIKRENRQEALMKDRIMPGINSVTEIVKIEGKSYAVVAQNGSNEVLEYISHDDGSYELKRFSTLGTQANDYRDGATAEGTKIRESIFLELQCNDLVDQIRRRPFFARWIRIPGTTNNLSIEDGNLVIETSPNEYRSLREFVASNPDDPTVRALNTEARTKLTHMEDISEEKLDHERFAKQTLKVSAEGRTVFFSVSETNIGLERIAIDINENGVFTRTEMFDPTTNSWNVNPGTEQDFEHFLNDQTYTCMLTRLEALSGVSDYLMSDLNPEERGNLNLESKRVQFTMGADNFDLELFVTESGSLAYYDRSDPNHIAKIRLLDGIDFFQTYYDQFDHVAYTAPRHAGGIPDVNSALNNPCIQIKLAYARSLIEAEQRRLRRR